MAEGDINVLQKENLELREKVAMMEDTFRIEMQRINQRLA